jgi:hypothetical protein
VLDALDEASGYEELDGLLRDSAQFVTACHERRDTRSVLDGFRAILEGRESASRR